MLNIKLGLYEKIGITFGVVLFVILLLYGVGVVVSPVQVFAIIVVMICIGVVTYVLLGLKPKISTKDQMEVAKEFSISWWKRNFSDERLLRTKLIGQELYFKGSNIPSYGFLFRKEHGGHAAIVVKSVKRSLQVVNFKDYPHGLSVTPKSPFECFPSYLRGAPIAKPEPEPLPLIYPPIPPSTSINIAPPLLPEEKDLKKIKGGEDDVG